VTRGLELEQRREDVRRRRRSPRVVEPAGNFVAVDSVTAPQQRQQQIESADTHEIT